MKRVNILSILLLILLSRHGSSTDSSVAYAAEDSGDLYSTTYRYGTYNDSDTNFVDAGNFTEVSYPDGNEGKSGNKVRMRYTTDRLGRLYKIVNTAGEEDPDAVLPVWLQRDYQAGLLLSTQEHFLVNTDDPTSAASVACGNLDLALYSNRDLVYLKRTGDGYYDPNYPELTSSEECYSYDGAGRLEQVYLQMPKEDDTYGTYCREIYEYDPKGNMLTKIVQDFSGAYTGGELCTQTTTTFTMTGVNNQVQSGTHEQVDNITCIY